MIMRMLSRLMTIAFSRTRMAVGYGVLTCALVCWCLSPKADTCTDSRATVADSSRAAADTSRRAPVADGLRSVDPLQGSWVSHHGVEDAEVAVGHVQLVHQAMLLHLPALTRAVSVSSLGPGTMRSGLCSASLRARLWWTDLKCRCSPLSPSHACRPSQWQGVREHKTSWRIP